jgi:hypothetical protein
MLSTVFCFVPSMHSNHFASGACTWIGTWSRWVQTSRSRPHQNWHTGTLLNLVSVAIVVAMLNLRPMDFPMLRSLHNLQRIATVQQHTFETLVERKHQSRVGFFDRGHVQRERRRLNDSINAIDNVYLQRRVKKRRVKQEGRGETVAILRGKKKTGGEKRKRIFCFLWLFVSISEFGSKHIFFQQQGQ